MKNFLTVLRLRFARAKAVQKISGFARPLKRHLGCGQNRLDGWVNLDQDPSAKADVFWDLNRPLPLEENSCRYIYCEHVIEHFTLKKGLALLRECRRVLQAGGILRLATPSLDNILEKSCSGDWRNQDWLQWPEYRNVQTRAEMLNMVFRAWGHEWVYDREELRRRLQEAGFTVIRDAEFGKSSHDVLNGLETRKDSLLICEVQK